jgi:hypothetical protein
MSVSEYKDKRQFLQLFLHQLNIHAPANDSEAKDKDQFYEQLEQTYSVCPKNDMKLLMGVANGRETVHQLTTG